MRAYHFGPRFLVELEIVMHPDTPLRESHDCGILLQHKIEALPSVERCFVHIDYAHREVDNHDHETPVLQKMHSSMQCASPEAGVPLLTESNIQAAQELPQACRNGFAGAYISTAR